MTAPADRSEGLGYDLAGAPPLDLSAALSKMSGRIGDTTTDGRWPRWNTAVRALSVRSVLSTPLVVGGESIRAMKVYCQRPMNYGAHDEQVMRSLAEQAAILLSNSQSLQEARRLSRQLTGALASRDTIAQAVGVLLGQGAASAQDAFTSLARVARQTNRPVEEIAPALITTVVAGSPGSSAR